MIYNVAPQSTRRSCSPQAGRKREIAEIVRAGGADKTLYFHTEAPEHSW